MTRQPTARTPVRQMARLSSLALAGLFAAGCTYGNKQLDQARAELRQAREQNAKLTQQLEALQQTVADGQKQIQTLQGLGQKRMDLLFHVTGIKLGRYTAGVDVDGKAGDDGIRVYLRPVDRDGHAIKAAGAVTVELFDLAAKPDENLLARYDFSVEEIASYWSAGFMTYHYRFECPWKSHPPANPEVTVRAAFTDYFTGKSFTAQKVCKVKLPGPPTRD